MDAVYHGRDLLRCSVEFRWLATDLFLDREQLRHVWNIASLVNSLGRRTARGPWWLKLSHEINELLLAGPEHWNRVRKEDDYREITLAGFRSSQLPTDGSEAFDTRLTKYDFSFCRIEDATFDTCLIENCDFTNSWLVGARIFASKFRECCFAGASFIQSVFHHSDIEHCSFDFATFTDCVFAESSLRAILDLKRVAVRSKSAFDLGTVRRSLSTDNRELRVQELAILVKLGLSSEIVELI